MTLAGMAVGMAVALLGACPAPPPPGDWDAGPTPGIGGVLAVAGADLEVLEGSRVQLAGEGTRALAGSVRLSWSQTAGPPVLLTNPSSSLPSFVAPLAPAVLTFELHAEADGDLSTDEVTVMVGTTLGALPSFLEAPGDALAEPGSTHSFRVDASGNPQGDVRLAVGSCRGGTVSVAGTEVTVVLPDQLPCGIVIDGADDSGRGLAPTTRVFWPTGTPLAGTTRVEEPSFPPPGSNATISLAGGEPESRGYLWSADGAADVLGGVVEGDQVAFTVPRRRGRLALAAERRLAGTSGGLRVAFVEVTDGTNNIEPHASAGDDRIVQPSARFRIDTSGSTDLDGDPLEVSVTQVLGASATPVADTDDVFQAPSEPGTLLFHVVADDGVVRSASDSVRVVVSAEAENLRPIVPIAPRRFVAPGQAFTVDGRVAEDPDSGLLSSITIRQLDEDPAIVLPEPAELVASLVAGVAGEVYHFEITAFDDQGLGGSAMHEVVVEEAGPYVDPARGDDGTGNGTVAAPFATLAGALPTAIDHELAELLLAEGEHAPVGGTLPAGLSLRGGLHYDGGTYVDGGAETVLPIRGAALVVTDGKLAGLRARLEGADSLLSLAGSSSIAQCSVERIEDVAAGAVVVQPQASAVIEGSVLGLVRAPGVGRAAVEVLPGGALRIRNSSVLAGAGDEVTAVSCERATLAIEGGEIRGGLAVDEARAVVLRACDLDLAGATLIGGSGVSVVGLAATDSVIATDLLSHVTGADAPSDDAIAVLLEGADGSALLEGALEATAPAVLATVASGVRCVDGALALVQADVKADGAGAVGVSLARATLSAVDTTLSISGGGTGLSLVDASDVGLQRVTVNAAQGILGAASYLTLVDTHVVAAEAACLTPETFVVLEDTTLEVDGPGSATALAAAGAVLKDATLWARGSSAEGVRLGTGASLIERTRVEAEGSAGAGIVHGGSLLLSSSFISGRGVPAMSSSSSVATATLRSATLVSDVEALRVASGAALEIFSTVLFGAPGLRATSAPPWLSASALAVDDSGPLLSVDTEDVTTPERLAELGCAACLVVPASLVDATGHLAAGANALVDSGDEDQSAPDDLDGEARPAGAAPDIGCDERP